VVAPVCVSKPNIVLFESDRAWDWPRDQSQPVKLQHRCVRDAYFFFEPLRARVDFAVHPARAR